MLTTPPTPLRILLFAETSTEANLLAEYLDLASIDHELSRAGRLDEGLEKIRTESFDLVLLDLSLPGSRGIATVEAVRDSAKNAAIILLIDSRDEDHSSEALQAGAQDCLLKEQLSAEVLGRSIEYAIERTQLKSILEEKDAMLHSIFEAHPDAMLVLDRKYEIVHFNPAATSLLGAEGISLIGETFPFEISTSQTPEVEIPEADGGSRVVQFKVSKLSWKGEQAKLIMMRDITTRRNFENALKREQKRLTVILETIRDAVIATDANGMIEAINAGASRLTGVSPLEAPGKALSRVLRLKNPQTGELITHPSEQTLKELGKLGFTLIRAEDESARSVTAEIRPILDEEDNHHGSIIVLKEIKQQKQSEEAELREDKLNSISLLAGGIAHDFNNMLAAILGNISLVRMNLPEEDANADKLIAAESAALQARSLTQQLLSFSKGGITSLESTAIHQVVEESARFVLRGSNVKCDVDKEKGLWAVDADKGQISQVVHNLIINADQAMPSGGTIRLKLSNCRLENAEVPELQAGKYVCIEITDQGIGICPEDLKRVFDPYFTTKADGNGLGLASSHAIIKNHHGAITVDSEVDQGTCFRVYLPKTTKRDELPQPEEEPKPQAREPIHRGSGRILVMDDMEAMMLVAGEILNVLGYEVEFTANGEQAIEAYKKAKESGNPFDAVVFDLTVPGGMGGEEASNTLIQYDPDLVAIASSGYTTSNIMSDYKNSAFKAVVPKPYRIKEMSDALNRVLNKPD